MRKIMYPNTAYRPLPATEFSRIRKRHSDSYSNVLRSSLDRLGSWVERAMIRSHVVSYRAFDNFAATSGNQDIQLTFTIPSK